MKRVLLSTLLILFGLISFSQSKNYNGYKVSYEETKGSIVLTFVIDTFDVAVKEINGQQFTTIKFPHGVNTFKKGFAELPMLNTALQIGDQNDVEISAEGEEFTEIKLDYPLLPSRGTIYRDQDPEKVPYVIAPESMVDAWYPGELAESTDPFVFRDTRGVNIYAYPFEYNAVKQVLRVYKSVKVVIKENTKKSTNPIKVKPSKIDASVNEIYKSLYINYSDSKFSNQLDEFGDMLVIYTSRDASAIQPYIEWKRQKGFNVTTQQVSTGTNVKSIIQNAYSANPNLLYVQLVGDWADIKSDLGTGQNAPMDPYLGCVSGNDYYPELIIGRFSANSSSQVTVQVNKAINYEKNPDMSGTWYKATLGMARNEGAGAGDDSEGDDQHMENIRLRLLSPSYNYTTFYREYDGNSSYVSSNTTASKISSRINSGVSVLNYCNHGLETGWSVGNYSSSDVVNLSNGNKLPVIFSVACVVGKFHRTAGDCFAETWLKKENGGAVATIMSTINQPWQPPMRGQDYFNDILIGGYNYSSNPGNGTSTTASDKRTTFGSITFNGDVLMLAEQYTNTDTRETFQTWTIFGDASLQVRTNTPSALSVTAGDVTGSPYTVTVKSNGSPVQDALVALYQNGNTYRAFTNSQGVASITHSLSSGSATLTVTGYNLGTYQGTVNVGTSGTVPATPSGLSTSNITTNSATLSWSAVSGATSYDVQIRPQGGSYSTYNVTTNSYNATGLSANTTYEWHVRAKNSYGTSSYSSIKSFSTQANPTGVGLPYSQSFSSSSLPSGWTTQNTGSGITERWSVSNSNKAGGSAYEMKCSYQNVNPGTTRLITPAINTVGKSQITLTFKHMFDAYSSGATLRVQTSNDKSSWTNTSWSKSTSTSNITARTETVTITTNLNSSTTYIAFVVEGNIYNIDYWYVDDVSVTAGSAASTPTVTTGSVSNVTSSSATVSGNVTSDGGASVTARGICYSTSQNPTISNSKVASGSGTGSFSATLTGLSPNTTYYARAYATNAQGTSYGNQVSFTTQSGSSVTYCTSKGKNSSYEWIDLVQFAGINRTSGNDGGYKDMTSMQATVNPGSSYTIYISAGFSSSSYTEYWAIWIDFNHNGTFEDSEKVVSGSSSSSSTLSATVSIPSTATLGVTRMRVSMKYNAAPTACETFTYGEVEDYSVNITSRRSDDTNPTIFADELGNENPEVISLFPNPANSILNLRVKGLVGDLPVRIFDIQGRLVKETSTQGDVQTIDVSNLSSGIYIIEVLDEREPLRKQFIKQ
jgi:gingipain R